MNGLRGDLEDIVGRNAEDFRTLRGARILITGGTGFVGSWLVNSFVHANDRLALGASATILTRDPNRFRSALPKVAHHASIVLVKGDVRDPSTIEGNFDAVIHAATPASATVNLEQPEVMISTIIEGTRRVLDIASRNGAIPFLLTSSGAVYGRQPPDLRLVDENYRGSPDPLEPSNAYHEGKRVAELLCAIADHKGLAQAKIARLFAFIGPFLPIDRHFAVGNFIRDALAGGPIEVAGDGTPVRTYQYAADMTSWLWRILVRGARARAYNVGSETIVDIRATANAIATETPGVEVVIKQTPREESLPERYACSTLRARAELDLAEWTSLSDAILRTLAWHRSRPTSV